jgi:hypothetical protein
MGFLVPELDTLDDAISAAKIEWLGRAAGVNAFTEL